MKGSRTALGCYCSPVKGVSSQWGAGGGQNVKESKYSWYLWTDKNFWQWEPSALDSTSKLQAPGQEPEREVSFSKRASARAVPQRSGLCAEERDGDSIFRRAMLCVRSVMLRCQLTHQFISVLTWREALSSAGVVGYGAVSVPHGCQRGCLWLAFQEMQMLSYQPRWYWQAESDLMLLYELNSDITAD